MRNTNRELLLNGPRDYGLYSSSPQLLSVQTMLLFSDEVDLRAGPRRPDPKTEKGTTGRTSFQDGHSFRLILCDSPTPIAVVFVSDSIGSSICTSVSTIGSIRVLHIIVRVSYFATKSVVRSDPLSLFWVHGTCILPPQLARLPYRHHHAFHSCSVACFGCTECR